MHKNVGLTILALLMLCIIPVAILMVNFDITPKALKHKATVEVAKEVPQIVKGNVTLRTFQGYYPIVIYGTEYYFDGNIIHIKDEKLGYMQIVYDDDCILIPGWIKDDKELSKFGVIKLDADYGLSPQ